LTGDSDTVVLIEAPWASIITGSKQIETNIVHAGKNGMVFIDKTSKECVIVKMACYVRRPVRNTGNPAVFLEDP
jgi:hypothetical protein